MWRIICNTQGRNLSKLDFDRKKPEIELLNREDVSKERFYFY